MERNFDAVIKKSLSQIRDFLGTPGLVEMVIVLILTVLDALIFRESNSDLLLPTTIGSLQVILITVATYLPLFIMVVIPTSFLALTFFLTEQAPMQIFCALLVVEVMRASNNKVPARVAVLLLLMISDYNVNTSTFARDRVATFVTTPLFVIAYAVGMVRNHYKEQYRQATVGSNRALEEQRLELATVLHDFTARPFARVAMLAQMLATEREGTDKKLEQSLEDIAETSREGLLQLHQLLFLLKPTDDESSLTSAIGQGERVPSMSRVLQQTRNELQEVGFSVSPATRIETEPSLTQISEVVSPALSEFCTNIQKYGKPQANVHIPAPSNEEDGFTLDINNRISKVLPHFLPRAMLSSGLELSSLHW